MRKPKWLLAAVAVAAGLSLAAAPAASAADGDTPVTSLAGLKLRPAFPAGTHAPGMSAQVDEPAYLLGPASDPDRCLDADTNTIGKNGTKVQLWTCNPYADNQAWHITQNPEGFIRFQNVASGRYLDADLGTLDRNGTKVQLWDFIGGAKNQWFTVAAVDGQDGVLRIQSAASGRYLDADLGTSGRDGTIVQLWDFVGAAANQWWY